MKKLLKDLNWRLLLGVFLSVLLLLFGVQVLDRFWRVERPLQTELDAHKEIIEFSVEPLDEGLRVKAKLARTENLGATLEFIRGQVEKYHHRAVVDWELESNPSRELDEAFYELSFNVEETQNTGEYTVLKEALDYFENSGVKARTYFTSRFIYVQLEAGKNFAYRALPRNFSTNLESDNKG